MEKIFALIDCNNFYASYERVFNPKLMKRPTVALSNSDGFVVARSEESKALCIPMSVPAFQWEEVLKNNNLAVLTSNYTLCGYAPEGDEYTFPVLSRHRVLFNRQTS